MDRYTVIDVILPVPTGNSFSYMAPPGFDKLIGHRVIVPFGKRKFLTGIVSGSNPNPNPAFTLKEVTEILDEKPLVGEKDIAFWRWLANYYMCSVGEVMQAAVPGGLLVESSSVLIINNEYFGNVRFEGVAAKLFEWLTVNKKGELRQIEKSLGIKNTFRAVKNLLDASAIFVDEKLGSGYSTKTETYVSASDLFGDEAVLNAFFESLKRAPKQEALLTKYYALCEDQGPLIPRSELIGAGNYGNYRSLLKKGAFKEHVVEISRLNENLPAGNPFDLTPWQEEARKSIVESFLHKQVVLLKGAPASGKTEIYIQLISEYIKQGKQVLFLVPEIGLTTQLNKRLKRVFGNKMALFHSKYNFDKRNELWKTISEPGKTALVLGARSALFMPFHNLGLIVIDEEHERSLKQQNPSPRYHARDAAIVLAGMSRARVLLGSSTPSVESWFNAKKGKYGFVELTKRYNTSLPPEISVIDLNASYKKRKLKYHFSFELLDEISETLKQHKQVILFQNRRGYAPVVECKTCGWVQKCRQCDVSLTWHFDKHLMGCHYCGHAQKVVSRCPSCGGEALMDKGFGTEKVEAEIAEIYPDASIKRFDADTTRGLKSMETILKDFEEGNIDILIGTQMVSRGLDFNNVGLVGVLNADNLLNFPDFRASERAFQMLTQVAGRAGRRTEQGKVVVQTHSPDHPVIAALTDDTQDLLLNAELAERQLFKYPPFNRIVDILMKHPDKNLLNRNANAYANALKQTLGKRVLGPEVPLVGRIKGLYIEHLLVKAESASELERLKQLLVSVKNQLEKRKEINASVRFNFDVDPH